ncbi:TetR/AcrR family transcriptional regulator [Microbulbifer sp. TYP-18]|uniref:TetR/AcrR family transcriptional regulator n=1 Tax=Microbulbifer sp. TYP-18 TaxID=3230024 RepID=UPI0034C5E878
MPRTPQRRNGRKKFEKLLDNLEQLLQFREASEITLAGLSETAGVPTASVYHFFPSRSAALAALTQRYFSAPPSAEQFIPAGKTWLRWQDLFSQFLDRLLSQFSHNIPMQKLKLGPTPCWATRELLVEYNRALANLLYRHMQEHFILPSSHSWRERFLMAITIVDSFWSLSFSRDHQITEQANQESKRAALAYLRLYLGETLTRRLEAQALS